MSDGVQGDRARLDFTVLFPNDTSQNLSEYERPGWVEIADIGKVKVGYQPKDPRRPASKRIDDNIKKKEPLPEPPRHVKIIADAVATVFILLVSIGFLALLIIGFFVLAGKLI